MSKVFGIVFGIIVFCVFFTIIFNIGNQMNAEYGVTVDPYYAENTGYYQGIGESANNHAMNISSLSPGGSDGQIGVGGEDMQVGGVRAMAQIFSAPARFKTILMGSGGNNTGIANKMGIDPMITQLAITGVFLLIALILIGAILRNRI